MTLLSRPMVLAVLMAGSVGVWIGALWYSARMLDAQGQRLDRDHEGERATAVTVRSLPQRVWEKQQFKSVAERNLFSPDRRPFPTPVDYSKITPPPPTPTPVVKELKDYKYELRGVLSFGRYKRAFISARAAGENIARPFDTGERVGDYTVSVIQGTEVYLAKNQEDILKLVFDRFGKGGTFESSYRELLEEFQIEEGEKIYEEQRRDGSTLVYKPMTISGFEHKDPLRLRPEVLEERLKTGEAKLDISGVTFTELPQGMRTQPGTVVLQPGGTGAGGGATISGITLPPRQPQGGQGGEGGADDGTIIISGQRVPKPTGNPSGRGVTISGVKK